MAAFIDRTKEKFNKKVQQEGMRTLLVRAAVIVVAILAIGNLAFSQVHIGVIVLVFNRVIGLVMFSFVLFGLVSLFAVTRLTTERATILRAILAISFTIIFGSLYAYLLMRDVITQETVTYYKIYDSFMSSLVILIGYLISIILLVVGEFVYGRK